MTAGEAVERDKKAARLQRINGLGAKDGLAGHQLHKNEIYADAPWEAVESTKAYESGYKDGEAKKKAALQKARDLGLADRKAGKPVHIGEIQNWPEVKMLLPESAGQTLLMELLAAYNQAATT